MKQTADNTGTGLFARFRSAGIDGRILRSMAAASVLAIVAGLPFVTWRTSVSLLLGGLLALVNYHWLSNSSAAALSVVAHGVKPRIRITQYVLRYAVIAATIYFAYQLGVVAIPATLVGLSTFVVALFVEAFREAYLGITHREEIS
ncbi:MAG TPA: ATP synthase subunit I [Pyrinomonadaceae bacterium]|nr:ATP synthase subunit I [Pyrinomonadaceae bacterium]